MLRSSVRFASVAPLVIALLAAVPVSAVADSAAPSWSVQPTPRALNPAASDSLREVSCPSTGTCVAVGTSFVGVDSTTLAERWSKGVWGVQPVVAPSDAQLTGVSCATANACMAVGTYVAANASGTAAYPLAERWNGLAWVITPIPIPAGADAANVSAVSCTSADACTAVGITVSSGALLPLAERWNGLKWVIEPTPYPAGAVYSDLRGVSCTSALSCTAVGTYAMSNGGEDFTLAERWDGKGWTVQSTPSPGGDNTLDGVSCTSSSACTAVGYYVSRAGTLTLAERWDGTNWTLQPTPNPAGQQSVTLHGVSCASADACTAVGEFNNPGVSAPSPLAEHWDGTTWTIQPVPDPTQAQGSQLFGVSCTSPDVCTAVGLYYTDTVTLVTDHTLAERYS